MKQDKQDVSNMQMKQTKSKEHNRYPKCLTLTENKRKKLQKQID